MATRAEQRRNNAAAAQARRKREEEERKRRAQFDTRVTSIRDTGISNQSRIVTNPPKPKAKPKPVDRRGRPVSRGGTAKKPATPRTLNTERKPVDRRGRPVSTASKPATTQKTAPRTGNTANKQNLTFGTAFKNARNAGQKTFMYQGSRFTTETKAEAKKAGKPSRTSSFGEAFAAARKAGKKTFSFNGKRYTTKVK